MVICKECLMRYVKICGRFYKRGKTYHFFSDCAKRVPAEESDFLLAAYAELGDEDKGKSKSA